MNVLGILDLPPAVQFLAVLCLASTGWLLGWAALRLLEGRYKLNQRLLPVGPTLAAVTTMFALFVGFLAGDVWDQKHRATDAAYSERSSVTRLLGLTGPRGLDDAAAHAAVLSYRRAVVEQEWGADRNTARSQEAQSALDEMRSEAMRLAESGAPSVLIVQLFRDLDALSDARDIRLAIGAAHGGSNAWFTVVVLYLVSFVAIAVVHLDRPAAGMLAMTVFAVATCLALWFLALHDSPYGGGVILESAILELAPPGS